MVIINPPLASVLREGLPRGPFMKRGVTSFLSQNGYSVAQNFKVLSSEVARAVFRLRDPSITVRRPQFFVAKEESPSDPVALLVGAPMVKFLAACREDKISPANALKRLQAGDFPSFHFLPQSRYLYDHKQPVYLWKSPDHIVEFWSALELGDPPQPRARELSSDERAFIEAHGAEVIGFYKEDVELHNSIMAPRTRAGATSGPPSFSNMLSSFYTSAKHFLKNGAPVTPPEALATREATCRACAEWDAAALNSTGRCRKCGCSTWAKLRMATEKCPLGKWESLTPADH